jgi:hypothetical protein
MKEVKLIFPDTRSMADFITKQDIGNAEVNSREQTVIAALPDNKIALAETMYGAILKKMIPKN